MQECFRIHGDNIVECERIVKLLVDEVSPSAEISVLQAPSTISTNIKFDYQNTTFDWKIELLPGFNKSGRRRWNQNIFDILKQNGSFLDETPDAIITKVIPNENKEIILVAIEFCSALQAGNQAWQRSGRAYSTGLTGCPYIYIVDFVKYELDANTRDRKALRFPNAAVPYSYVSFSKEKNLNIVQAYFRSEEFDKNNDLDLKKFDERNFAENDLRKYLVKVMLGINTQKEWADLIQKNFNVVQFLANISKKKDSYTAKDWTKIYNEDLNVLDYAINHYRLEFSKKIAEKSCSGKVIAFLNLVKKYSIGIASKDLPFGTIPANKRNKFANELFELYPNFDKTLLSRISNQNKDLLLCLIKGFKPRGDDNRPDRGVLPFAKMLVGDKSEIMTFLYGPILNKNFTLLSSNPNYLAQLNGFWNVILSLSDFVALDSPLLDGKKPHVSILYDFSSVNHSNQITKSNSSLKGTLFSSQALSFHEDDVDTAIHYLFAKLLKKHCFEGMCNPPGGDWSGLSILDNNMERRWLSLPRVSDSVDGKRPDHVLQLSKVIAKPILLSIESKENSSDLEENVGIKLKEYIKQLMNYVPNVEQTYNSNLWRKAQRKSSYSNFDVVSAAAYLSDTAQIDSIVFDNSRCDMLFILQPNRIGKCKWKFRINAKTETAKQIKNFLIQEFSNNEEIKIE